MPTPQYIVIGGAAGAMPPVLGRVAVTNDVSDEALSLAIGRMQVATRLLRALSIALVAVACTQQGPPSTGSSFGRDFALHDHNGNDRTLADFRGKAVVVFFGYTECPDVCPTTLASLAEAMKELGPDADRVQVLFITVDPERDTAELLSKYVPAFDPRFLGLRGSAEETERTAKEFRVRYQKQPGTSRGGYTMDHSLGTFIFDPQGRLRLHAQLAQGPDVFAHDLRELLKAG